MFFLISSSDVHAGNAGKHSREIRPPSPSVTAVRMTRIVFPAEYKKSRDTDRSRLGTGPSVNQEKSHTRLAAFDSSALLPGGRRCFATCGGGGGTSDRGRGCSLFIRLEVSPLHRLDRTQAQVCDLATVSRGYLTRALRFLQIWTAGSRQLMYYSAECSFFINSCSLRPRPRLFPSRLPLSPLAAALSSFKATFGLCSFAARARAIT